MVEVGGMARLAQFHLVLIAKVFKFGSKLFRTTIQDYKLNR
jgi:hypothetical protein